MLRVLQNQFTLDAQSLRDVPLFLPGFAAPQGFVGRCKPLFDLICFAETGREFAQRKQEARQEPGAARPISLRKSTSPASMLPRLAITMPLKQPAQSRQRRIAWRSVCSNSTSP